VQKDVGKSFKVGSQEWFKGFVTSAPQPFGAPTVFGNGNGELDCPHCKHGCECENCKKGIGECSDKRAECNAWDIGCELFGLPQPKSCECEACKNGTGECSDKVPACNAWDIGCEITGGKPLVPESTWFWIKIILVLIGIGILLWLLRPLFGIAKNITET